jgi:KipI family sensor histidine kinase inhibitor
MPRVTPAGDHAFLVDLGNVSADELHAAACSVRGDDVLAVIPGQRSLYVVMQRADERVILERLERTSGIGLERRVHEIPVSFARDYGLDLPEFLQRTCLTEETFLERLRALRLVARYLGFRAGFAYLDGWPREWSMPRRPTSRARVAQGSFAIANAVAGFYPIDSPGGWNILGRTDAALWDPLREPPNMIAPGDEVRIVPHDGPIVVNPARAASPLAIDGIEMTEARFTTIVGKREWGRLDAGLTAGGPFDDAAAAHANALVGNAADAPILECAMAGPRIRATRSIAIAWAGAECDLPQAEPRMLGAGEEIAVGRIRNGMRGYLAVGRTCVRASARTVPARAGTYIECAAGPHASSAREIDCIVTPQLDRVGIRLRPRERIDLQAPADLPSCGMQFGTVQLHPDGSLVAMGPDHPVTGGYLQIMTVLWSERWKLGQLSPGDEVILRVSSRPAP